MSRGMTAARAGRVTSRSGGISLKLAAIYAQLSHF